MLALYPPQLLSYSKIMNEYREIATVNTTNA
jgi:hypothetical protein